MKHSAGECFNIKSTGNTSVHFSQSEKNGNDYIIMRME